MIPCEECITYAICKISVDKKSGRGSIVELYHKKRCHFLQNYLHSPANVMLYTDRLNNVRSLFELNPVKSMIELKEGKR